MTDKLSLIRQKCIEANPDKKWMSRRASHGGRVVPIIPRIADVLLAFTVEMELHHEPDRLMFRRKTLPDYQTEWGSWNLRQDDLSKQSEDTISFLYELLKVEDINQAPAA